MQKKEKSPVHWPQQHNSGGQFYSSEPLSTRGRVKSSLNTNVSAKQINAKAFTDTEEMNIKTEGTDSKTEYK